MIELAHPPRRAARARPATALTLRALQEVLSTVEAREGLVVARRLVAALDYVQLNELAREGLRRGCPDDDPRQVDRRYLLLLGATGPEVEAHQAALGHLGLPCPVTGTFDERTLACTRAWLASVGRVDPPHGP